MKPVALVIDDDEMFQVAIRTILDGFGLSTAVTSDPDTFLTKALLLKPVIAIVDLNINSSRIGFRIIETFRKQISNKTPIIVVTGAADHQAISFAFEAGATDFIHKTIDKSYLGLKLSRYIKTQKLMLYKNIDYPVPESQGKAELILTGRIESIDELGLTFETLHQFPAGVVIKANSDIIKEIKSNDSPILITIVSSILNETGDQYTTVGEFDPTNTEFQDEIRRWLASRT